MEENITGSFDQVLGGKVKKLRIMSGMSQQNVADLLGVTFQQVQKYERGTNRITAKTIYILAKYFRIPYKELFDGTNHKLGDVPLEVMKPLSIDMIHSFNQLTKRQMEIVIQITSAFICVNNS